MSCISKEHPSLFELSLAVAEISLCPLVPHGAARVMMSPMRLSAVPHGRDREQCMHPAWGRLVTAPAEISSPQSFPFPRVSAHLSLLRFSSMSMRRFAPRASSPRTLATATAPLSREAQAPSPPRRRRDILLAMYREQVKMYQEHRQLRRQARRRRLVNLAEILEVKYWKQVDVRHHDFSRPPPSALRFALALLLCDYYVMKPCSDVTRLRTTILT